MKFKLVETFLNEAAGSIQELVNRYKKQLSEDEIRSCCNWDPTTKGDKPGKYCDWLINQQIKYANGKYSEEDEETFSNLSGDDIVDTLCLYNDNIKYFDEQHRNIQSFKTFSQLMQFVNAQKDDLNKEKEQLRLEKMHNIKPVVVGDIYTVYQPKSWEESKILRGNDAEWCTGDHRTDEHWKRYSSHANIFIFYKDGKATYQGDIEKNISFPYSYFNKTDCVDLWNGFNNARNDNICDQLYDIISSDKKVFDYFYKQGQVIQLDKSDIKLATLLTEKQAEKIPVKFRKASFWWWLRSHGYGSYYAAFVDRGGFVISHGTYVNINSGVRPALYLKNPESLNLEIGSVCKINDVFFLCALPGVLLTKDTVVECPFRTEEHCIEMSDCKNDNWKEEDKPYNEYKGSDVEEFVDKWFKNL